MDILLTRLRGARRVYLVAILLCSAAVAPAVAAGGPTTAVLDAGETTLGASGTELSTSTGASTSPPELVFHSEAAGALATYAEGDTTSLGATTDVVGPMHDVDGDGRLEAVYVDGDGQLHLVDEAGESEALPAENAPTSKTMFAVGDFDGDGTLAVFYPNTADNGYLYKVEYGSKPTRVATAGAKAALGIVDYDADGDADLVFVGGSSTIKYYDGSVHSTGYSSIGSNNGLGLGAPADFDGDGVPRVPIVDGSNNPALVAAAGSKTALKSGSAAKAPIAGADVTGDAARELVYVNKNGYVAYTTLGDDTDTVTTDDGQKLDAVKKAGVAPAAPPPAPAISDYAVENPADRDIRVSFNSTQELAEIEIDIGDGSTTVATLTEADVSESKSDGTYHYVGTYTADADGEYTATLSEAADVDGDSADSTPEGTVTVDGPPAIGDYDVTNPEKRELVVAFDASERLTDIAVDVDGPVSTTLTESAFEASTTATGYRYRATFRPDEDGTYTLTLRKAVDDAGHDSADDQSATVSIDTPDPEVTDASITDLDDGNGAVADSDRVRITATVEGADVTRVTADLSALGAGTVELAHAGGTSYRTTAVVDEANASRAGSFTFTVRARNTYDNTDARATDPLLLDTVAPTADTGPAVTVREGTKVVLDGSASADNIAIARYVWDLDTGERAVGKSVVHVYRDPGTYTVSLTVVDVAGNRDTATRTITVVNATAELTATATTTPTADGNQTIKVVETVRIVTTTDDTDANSSERRVRFQKVPVERIRFADEPPNGTLRVEQLPSLPPSLPAYEGTIIWPLRISPPNGTDVPARILFSVDRDALADLPPSAVVLLRHTDGEWSRLDTEVVTEGPTAITYAARTPGFSYFAIAVAPATSRSTTPGTVGTTAGEVASGGLLWVALLLGAVLVVAACGLAYREGYFDMWIWKARNRLNR